MEPVVLGAAFDTETVSDVSLEAVETYIRAAQQCKKADRTACLTALEDIFRSGVAPRPPLDGLYRGELLALDIAPGLTRVAESLAGLWLPWRGKQLDAVSARGINLFTNDSYPPARLIWPAYRGYRARGPETYQAFAFHTSVGPGFRNPDQQVLRLDYDLPENPRLFVTVRRILDEVVQVADGYYLGKAYVHWYWGRWSRVAYFALRAPMTGR